MYRIIKFKQNKGTTLARFNTEEDVAEHDFSAQEKSESSCGEVTKKHCVVEFERGTDNCVILAQFDTSEKSETYFKTVKDKHEPFGPFLILNLELLPDGYYDDHVQKPQYPKKGRKSK